MNDSVIQTKIFIGNPQVVENNLNDFLKDMCGKKAEIIDIKTSSSYSVNYKQTVVEVLVIYKNQF